MQTVWWKEVTVSRPGDTDQNRRRRGLLTASRYAYVLIIRHTYQHFPLTHSHLPLTHRNVHSAGLHRLYNSSNLMQEGHALLCTISIKHLPSTLTHTHTHTHRVKSIPQKSAGGAQSDSCIRCSAADLRIHGADSRQRRRPLHPNEQRELSLNFTSQTAPV